MTTKRPRSIRRRALPVVEPDVPAYAGLRRLGIDTADWDYVVALAGNPNTGKSTVFNTLTGLKQHVGNWPGKTVARAEGGFEYGTRKFKLVDLPGTYSLLSASTDEEIARDFILFGRPDCTIIVVDATVLERNLNLTLQILEITDRAVLCLNLMDEAERKGIDVDHERLERDLGIPVIPTVARTGRAIPELIEAVAGVAGGSIATRPHRIGAHGEAARSVEELAAMVEAAYPGLPNARWVAMRLLEGDKRVEKATASGELGELIDAQELQAAGAGGTD
jgi:ferrous iron transport protein B